MTDDRTVYELNCCLKAKANFQAYTEAEAVIQNARECYNIAGRSFKINVNNISDLTGILLRKFLYPREHIRQNLRL